MNKQQYMSELEEKLRTRKIQGIEDVLDEFEQHFAFKLTEGYFEEEIANRLEKPAVIAEQFAFSENGVAQPKQGQNVILGIGLTFADIFVSMFFVLLLGWVIVIGAFALASSVLGVCLICNINIAGLIPSMPYLGSLILGISCVGLGLLSSVGTIYSYLYVRQWTKAYMQWHRKIMNPGLYSRLQVHPSMSAKFKRRLRDTAMIALIVFGLTFIIGLFVMFAYTGFKPFWHELRWFVPNTR